MIEAGVDDHTHHAADHRAIDAQPTEATVPELDDIQWMLTVIGPARKIARGRGEDVIQAGPDDSQDEHPGQQVPHVLGVFAASFGFFGGEPGRQQSSHDDQYPVPVNLERPNLD